MRKINKIPIALCRSALSYDPDSGFLKWKVRDPLNVAAKAFNSRFAGKIAGFDNGTGYLCINLYGKMYLAHRVAWAIHYGQQPELDIDHIDRVRTNNAIKNLRVVSHTINVANRSAYRKRKDGSLPTGVYFKKDSPIRPYVARLTANGKSHLYEHFTTVDNAVARYRQVFREIHGHEAPLH